MMNMMITPTPRAPHQQLPVKSPKPRVLLVSDSPERAGSILSRLHVEGDSVTVAATAAELRRACRRGHALAIVDVGPERLIQALRILRGCPGCAGIPVLVENSRLAAAPDFAGVLPQFRAMACGSDDLLKLARRRLSSLQEAPPARRLL
jgi:CheY-like chemotaxis protein